MLPELSIDVPIFARVTDYAGVWAMEPSRAAAFLDRVRKADLPKHVAETPPPKPKSDLQTVSAANGQKVGVVMLTGPLMKAVGSMEPGTSTVMARRDLRKAANDSDISAIILAIDSPGGTVAGTADLAAEIRSAAKKKPVWAYASDLCASAAYWCACQTDKTFANDRTALVGSIGTLLVAYDVSEMFAAEGIKTLVFGTGPIKGAGTPGSVVTDEQKAYFRGVVDDAQVSFDQAVQKGRGLTAKQLADVKTGGVFGATEALSLGLIDGIKSFEAVVEEIAAESRRMKRESNQSNRATNPVPLRSTKVNENETTAGAGTATVPAPAANAANVAANGSSPVDEAVAKVRLAASAEADRIASIHKLAAGHPDIIAQAIKEEWTPEKAENAALKASLPKGVNAFNPAIISRSHERDCTVDVLSAAMMIRSGQRLDNPIFNTQDARASSLPGWLKAGINDPERNRVMDQAYRYRSMSLIDLCRESVARDGKPVPHDRGELIKAAVSGGTLTNIFTTNVNASVIVSYLQAGDTTLGWTMSEDVADFKTQERIRLETIGGTMKKLPRGGNADHASRADKVESYKVSRYAEQFVVDEQDIIDDSMNAIASTPGQMAMKAARLRPDLVYAIILANPTLTATARELFNTTDGNLGSSSALAAATLKTAIAAFMLVRENSVNLNITPTHLIVPPALKWTAKELINSTAIVLAGTAGTVTERGAMNSLAGEGLEYVTDARLENGVVDPNEGTTHSGSATSWYLASTMAPTIMVGYQGGRVPSVRSFTLDKGSYGIGWDIKLDIGAKAMDWRGLRKTTA
jgi:signal peptide peptidase SppA